MKRACMGALLVVVGAAARGQALRADASEPRAFGYQIGDTVLRHEIGRASCRERV